MYQTRTSPKKIKYLAQAATNGVHQGATYPFQMKGLTSAQGAGRVVAIKRKLCLSPNTSSATTFVPCPFLHSPPGVQLGTDSRRSRISTGYRCYQPKMSMTLLMIKLFAFGVSSVFQSSPGHPRLHFKTMNLMYKNKNIYNQLNIYY